MSKMEYNQNPTEIQKGEEIEGSWQVCGICFERIIQPILKGIWYHRTEKKHYDHEPIPATNLEQLFEIFCSDHLYYKKRKCKCYFKWRDTLNLKLSEGFIGDHWIRSDGLTLCGDIYADIHTFNRFKNAELKLPNKQDYTCEKCISKLVKLKKLKIIKHEDKSNNPIYNRLEWLVNT